MYIICQGKYLILKYGKNEKHVAVVTETADIASIASLVLSGHQYIYILSITTEYTIAEHIKTDHMGFHSDMNSLIF